MNHRHPEAIIDAIYSGDYKTIEQYVNKENINLLDKNGDSLLSTAATAIDVNMKIVRHLIKQGADVNIRLREGWTLLHSAAHLLRKNLVAVLLQAGCDPNAVNDDGHTALTKVLFAFNPKTDLIELLLENGADPSLKQPGCESAVEIATRTGQSDLFESV